MAKEKVNLMEAQVLWDAAFILEVGISGDEVLYNHCKDNDLKNFLKGKLDKVDKPMLEKVRQIMEEEKVLAPPQCPKKSVVDAEDIPLGASFTDQEIALWLSAGVKTGLIGLSGAMASFVREDIAAEFVKFHTEKVGLAKKLLTLMKEKEWLIVPTEYDLER